MRVAVVGAGFSGLAVSFHLLLQGAQVDLYDQKGIGGGASGVASGLLHPYAGEQVRRSWKAEESLQETTHLLQVAQTFSSNPVADFSGIIRKATPKQALIFLEHAACYGDVEALSDDIFLLKSGITVHSQSYLLGLYEACRAKGIKLFAEKISSFESLKEYDSFVLALGAGVFSFQGLESLKLSGIKGQSLVCKWPFERLERPLLGKGHIVPIPGTSLVHLGATYERGLLDEEACPSTAYNLLTPQAKVLDPRWKEIVAEECRAGVRVTHIGHATPWVGRVDKGWFLGAMGSRGLLYHAYFGKQVARVIVSGKDQELPLFKNSTFVL